MRLPQILIKQSHYSTIGYNKLSKVNQLEETRRIYRSLI